MSGTYSIDFGDSQNSGIITKADPYTGILATHNYATAGTYNFVLLNILPTGSTNILIPELAHLASETPFSIERVLAIAAW